MLIIPGRPVNTTETAERVALLAVTQLTIPLLCSEETSFPQVAQILGQRCSMLIQSSLRRKERERPWEVITSSESFSSASMTGKPACWSTPQRPGAQCLRPAQYTQHPPQSPGWEQWARSSVPNHLGFATRLCHKGAGVEVGGEETKGHKKHGWLARLRFWHALCVIEDSQDMGPWRLTNAMTANPMSRASPAYLFTASLGDLFSLARACASRGPQFQFQFPNPKSFDN